jgi:hypothetical protein
MGSSTVNDKPAGLRSRVRLGRVWCDRNWDMLFVAPLRRRRDGEANPPDCPRRANRRVAGNKG